MRILGAFLALAFSGSGSVLAETVAQWDFNGNLASSTGQAPLTAAAAAPASVPSVTFEDAVIGGQAAKVAHFTRGTYFRAHPGFPPNGGGIYVNQFTLMLDLMFPDRSPSGGWAALLQTNDTNSNDGEASSAYVGSFFFADKALSASEIASLGGPDAGGIAAGPCLSGPCKPLFRRGDANGDSSVDIADAIFTLLYLFAGGVPTTCSKSMDVNDDGAVQITDAIYELEFLFLGGPATKPPSPVCGEDPTDDSLGCELPGPCV